jgi:salicylate hydroxylase
MSLAGREVAVVGGGVGGLAAATALARRGARVILFEQAAALAEVGAGLQISPNGVAVLEALEVAEAAAECASLPEAVELRDHRRGRLVARTPLGGDARGRYGRPYWQLHRADLLAVLAEGAAAAGVDIQLGRRVVAAESGEEGAVLIAEDGGRREAEVVVAADGVRSGLRAAAGLAAGPARFTGHVAWRALVPAGRLLAEAAAPITQVTMGPGRHLVSYPLRGGALVNLVAVEERAGWTAEGWMTPADPGELRRAFAEWGGTARALLAGVEACFLWGLFDHPPLPAWAAGRLALLGDACHPMLPFLAQGATMALEDAWVLAAELDRTADPSVGLAAYAAARRARATRVQRAAARNGRIFHLRPGLRGPAQAALAAASALAPGWLAGRFDWLYGADVTAEERGVGRHLDG